MPYKVVTQSGRNLFPGEVFHTKADARLAIRDAIEGAKHSTRGYPARRIATYQNARIVAIAPRKAPRKRSTRRSTRTRGFFDEVQDEIDNFLWG